MHGSTSSSTEYTHCYVGWSCLGWFFDVFLYICDNQKHHPNCAFLAILYTTGLQITAVAGLTVSDVWDQGEVRPWFTVVEKNSRTRIVVPRQELRQRLEELIRSKKSQNSICTEESKNTNYKNTKKNRNSYEKMVMVSSVYTSLGLEKVNLCIHIQRLAWHLPSLMPF